jgi:cation-transporting ATPase G
VDLSIALISVLIPLALFGILGLATVVLIHEVAEVFVIANGVRAGRTKHLGVLANTAPRPSVLGATP